MKLMIFLYNLISWVLLAILMPFFPFFLIFSEKRRATLVKRFGIKTGIKKKELHEKRIWVHGLSVGEVLSAKPLLKALQGRGRRIIFTASTHTGFNIAKKSFLDIEAPLIDGLAYFPFDLSLSVARVTSRIDPDMVVIVETDLWPNFLWQMKKLNIPVFLVNTRLSNGSFKGYSFFKTFIGPIFSLFSMICVQTELDALRFKGLGVKEERIRICGNIKFDQEPPEIPEKRLSMFRACLGKKDATRVFLAGSTHPGEEKILADLFESLKPAYSDLVMVIVPRNPKRAEEVRCIFSARGIESRLFSELDAIGVGVTDIVVVDTMGVLAWLYALCDIAFIGGSLLPFGGHNLLEAAAFGKPVIFGSHMEDFALMAKMMTEARGAFMVATAGELMEKTELLLGNPDLAENMGQAAAELFYANQGAVDRIVALMEEFCA